MGFSSVLIISLAAGVVLIIGGGLIMYMSNLVKSAYDLKVQLKTDLDDRLNKISEDLDKKSKWIKRDLLEEIEKIRSALNADTTRRWDEMTGPILQRLDNMENAIRSERSEWVKAVDADRATLSQMETKLKSALKKIKESEEKPQPTPAPLAVEPAPHDSKVANDPAAAPEGPMLRPGNPTPVGDFLQELGGSGVRA